MEPPPLSRRIGGRLHSQEYPLLVDRADAVVLVASRVGHALGEEDSCIVDQSVQAAERCQAGLQGACPVMFVGYVGVGVLHVAAVLLRCLTAQIIEHVDHQYPCAELDAGVDMRTTHPPGRSGHRDHLAGQGRGGARLREPARGAAPQSCHVATGGSPARSRSSGQHGIVLTSAKRGRTTPMPLPERVGGTGVLNI